MTATDLTSSHAQAAMAPLSPTPEPRRRRRRRNPVVLRFPFVPSGFTRCGLLSWRRVAGVVQIVHPFDEQTVSDATVVDGLVGLVEAGVLSGQEQFESAAVDIIRGSAGTSADAWAAFYDNSLRELRSGTSAFAPVHHRARSLVAGDSLLEVGSCFGFFALACARDGLRVSACDISEGAVSLLSRASRRLGLPVEARVGDATRLPHDADSVDTVSLIHLLEHLDEPAALTAITEALRVARRRVVVAVPFEEIPSPHFGHRLRLTEDDLRRWAERVTHGGAEVFTDHGGWLVLTPA